MQARSAGDWVARIVAFLFAGSAVALGVAILISWIASWFGYVAGDMILVPLTAIPVVALAWRIFIYEPAPEDSDASSDEEQS